MKKSWILISAMIIGMIVSGCSSKSNDTDTSMETKKKASKETSETTTEAIDTAAKVIVNGTVYVQSGDGLATSTVPSGWTLLGTIINDEELPLDGELYGIGCGVNGQVYYNEQVPEHIYIGSGEETVRYKKFSVENLNWQYIAWEGDLFVRVSDLLESSKADSLTEEQKNTAVIELPLQAECIGVVTGHPVGFGYPTQNLEMNVPNYDGMYVCRDREDSNYIYVETFFHSSKRYIIFLKTERPAIP